jgi:hypothetical protein
LQILFFEISEIFNFFENQQMITIEPAKVLKYNPTMLSILAFYPNHGGQLKFVKVKLGMNSMEFHPKLMHDGQPAVHVHMGATTF